MELLLRPASFNPLALCCCFLFLFAPHHLLHSMKSSMQSAFPPVVAVAAAAAAHLSNETDRLALLRFKDEIIGDPFGVFTSWNHTRHFCRWKGVTCSGRCHPQRVTALNLSSCNLVARRISPNISNLTFLRRIDLSNNTFRGEIPADIGRLFRLRYLLLTNNTLSGEIPANLSYCSELLSLYLYGNKLSGNIPPEFGSLSKLNILYLGHNNLTGGIPPSFGNLSSLTVLYLSINRLESIPPELGQFMALSELDVSVNELSGIVPFSIYNLSTLQSVDLGTNRLQGDLPPHLFLALSNLEWFSVGGNRLTGTIPISLPNATGLRVAALYDNYLKGSVPINLGRLHHLRVFAIEGNELGSGSAHDWSFIDSLTNCSNLQIFDIRSNNLSGALPDSFANLSTQLRMIVVSHNLIYGRIPSGIGNLINLDALGMQYNMLTGVIPVSIGKLHNMVELSFEGNKLSGEIPDSFCNMTQLSTLYLSNSNLGGNIPQCIENCRQLVDLRLDSNNFKGTLPKQLFSFPSLIQILVENNSFSGDLQMDACPWQSLGNLDVSDNNFSGKIPSALGDCLSIEYIGLAGNHFHGVLPSTLNSLRGLRYLDLSRNQLSGKIPEYLEKMQLEHLNLSFNDFEGELPREGIFKNVSAISIIGNSKLCGGIEELHLPSCIQESSKKTLHTTKVKITIIVIVLVSALLFCLLDLFVYVWFKKSRKIPSSNSSCLEDPFMDVSYAELLKATDEFSSSNLIGMGSYGFVYKGNLRQNNIGYTIVAIKVLNLLQDGAHNSFMAECEALRNIRHRNLVKILSCCSSIDFKGNDFKALVFEYMPNGSLQNWLSKDDKGNVISGRNLKLIERLNIAIDVAYALDYLHYHCQEPIIHRDLKPCNVLLDADMVAHVGDFGLARFASAITQSSTDGMKGSIGYIAPEYSMGGKASTKGDVYSYRILVLEMMTGKKPTAGMFENNLTLHHHVRLAVLANQVIEIADPYLLQEETHEAVQSNDSKKKMCDCLASVAQIGVVCSTEVPGERMKMSEVVSQMHAIRDSYLGQRGQATQITSKNLGEGSSYLSHY